MFIPPELKKFLHICKRVAMINVENVIIVCFHLINIFISRPVYIMEYAQMVRGEKWQDFQFSMTWEVFLSEK